MAFKIELRDHPAKRHVQVSPRDRRHLYRCPKCNDNTAEPRNRPPGRKVKCETCQGPCEPLIVNALPEQHGIYVDGKCIGYCTKEPDAEIWYVDRVDPYIQSEIEKLIATTYGGDPVKYPYPGDLEVPGETDAADDEEDEAGNDFDDEDGDG